MIPWPTRVLYGFGQLPEGIKSAAFGFFLLFYYNQVLGLSAALGGIAVFIAVTLDAVSDPVVGSWSDFTRSRWGRRHPYMLWAAIPFAACHFALFAPPDGLSEMGLFLWLMVFASLTRTAMTFYAVPYYSLGAEITNDYDERTILTSLRLIFQLIGMFLVLIGGNALFFQGTDDFPNGQLNPAAYFPFAAACVPLLLAGVWVATAGTWQYATPSDRVPQQRTGVWSQVGLDLRTAFAIPSFVAIVIASVVFGVTQGMVQALHLYTATYFFELTSGQITFLFAGALTGMLLGSGSSRLLSAVFSEKRTVFIVGLAWYGIWTTSIIIARLLGWLPDNDDPIVAVLYISTGCISALGLGAAIPMIGSMIADVTDEHERRHGLRQEGIYYAGASFAAKVVGGIGPVFAGFVVEMAGISPGSAPQDVAAEAVARFGWIQGPAVLLLTAISIIAVCFFRISRARHAEILRQIDESRGRVTAGGTTNANI